MSKVIKKVLHITLIVFAIIATLLTTSLILLNNSKIQNNIINKLTSIASEKLETRVEIGYFRTNLYNRITLENIYIEDLDADTLLYAEDLNLYFELLPLFKKSIIVDKASLTRPKIFIKSGDNNELNLQFLIDVLQTDTTKESNLNVDIESIELIDGSLEFKNKRHEDRNVANIFDQNNIKINDLNMDATFTLISKSNLDLEIKKLSFNERSGFSLKNLSLAYLSTDTSSTIPYLTLSTTNSNISIDSAYLRYDDIKDISKDLNRVDCNIEIKPSFINLSDFRYFNSQIGNFRKPISLHGTLGGSIDNLSAENLSISYGNNLSLQGNIEANGLPDIKNTFFYSSVNLKFDKGSIQDIIANISKKPMILPEELNNLGKCTYKGNITGFLEDLVLYGSLLTDIGSVRTDIQMKVPETFEKVELSGVLSSTGLDINRIAPKTELDRISFELNTDFVAGNNIPFESNSKITIPSVTYKKHTYNDINIEGFISQYESEGRLVISDENAEIKIDGMAKYGKDINAVNFSSEIKKLNLHKLNLIDTYEDMTLSGNITANFRGDKWVNMNGNCSFDSIHIVRLGDDFLIKNIDITANNGTSNRMSIKGDLINGDIFGQYAFETVRNSAINIIAKDLPALKRLSKDESAISKNQFSFYADIVPTEKLCKILDIPWYTKEKAIIQGQFNDDLQTFYTELTVPNFSNGYTDIDNISLYFDNSDAVNLILKAGTKLKSDSIFAELSISGKEGELLTAVKFDNKRDSNMVAGELITRSRFIDNVDSQYVSISLLPSALIIKDKPWEISHSNITVKPNKINVDKLLAKGGDQRIFINGDASLSNKDSILIQLSNINLDHISELLPAHTAETLHFGGNVTGEAFISGALTKRPIIEANVIASKFAFNKAYLGTAVATSNFDLENNCLVFEGVVGDDFDNKTAMIDGKYYFLKDSLDIIGVANKLDMSFLNFYLSDILDNIKGEATGNVHIHGFTKAKTVAIDAKAFIDKAEVGIEFLNTRYFFADTIEINSKEIILDEITVFDKEGNRGLLDGYISHKYLQDMDYRIDIETNNILVLNTTQWTSDDFYGKAYATGNVVIFGNEQNGTTIQCKAQSDPNTNVVIPIDSYYASDNSFITFVNSNIEEVDKVNKDEDENINTNLFLDIMLDVTPSAEVALLINSKTGDVIKGRGNGNIRVTYDMNSNDMKMYGTYSITEGMYLFTFQNALTKEFTVKGGSSVSWTGSPVDAEIDIDAYYQLTASLADILDEDMLKSSSGRTSVPVQCLLNLTGNMMQPNINFDIELPNSDEELKRAVNNAINTEELVNRQTVSLLLLGKFMNTDLMNDNVNTQYELYSVVSSTLSSVLNSWASQLFNKWNFGLNYRPGYEGTVGDEYEFNFLYTPNDRITINGNVGYKDDALVKNKFIGDFDFEYKLIESGKLSSKIYTHTNDYKEFKQSLTTQGIGIVYRESFNSVKELWNGWMDDIKARKERRKKKRDERKAKRLAMEEVKKEMEE